MFNPVDAFLGLFSHDIGVDLGTANTLVLVRGKGIIINEPSVIAMDKNTRKVCYVNGTPMVGVEAKRLVGRTPAHIVAIRPLKDGVISDFDTAEQMLTYFINRVHERYSFIAPRPLVVMGIPSGVTEVERRAIEDATKAAGAREVYLVEEVICAAIGAGLPIVEPCGSMIVDIGGGTTEVAVFAMGGIVVSTSIRIAGDEMDQEIISYARQHHNLSIGERTAEEVKIIGGSAYPLDEERDVVLRGRDLVMGLPKAVTVSTVEIRDAISGPVGAIVDAVKTTIEMTPPELVTDLMEAGIILAGGGALLTGLARRLSHETRFPVTVAEDPLSCVVRGAGEMLQDRKLLRQVLAQRKGRKPPKLAYR